MRELSNKQLIVLAVILIVILLLVALFGTVPSSQPENAPLATLQTLPAPAAPTAAQMQELQNSPAVFQYLISYTKGGFQPDTLTVQKGDTVRFVNNSSEQLWVASVGSGSNQIYPGTSSCGGSTFDSCGPLQPGDFWEFTFTQSGTYDFQNNVDPTKSGTISITVK